jgi:hypothetical protein
MARYATAFTIALVVWVVIGFVVPGYICWRLYYNPNGWRQFDDEHRLLSVGSYVAIRHDRLLYSPLETRVKAVVRVASSAIADGTEARAAFERDLLLRLSKLLGTGKKRLEIRDVSRQKVVPTAAHMTDVLQSLPADPDECVVVYASVLPDPEHPDAPPVSLPTSPLHLTVAGHEVVSLKLLCNGQVKGPIQLRRFVQMLHSGAVPWNTRFRAQTKSAWIENEAGADTLYKLVEASREKRLGEAPRAAPGELGERELQQELSWLLLQQTEVDATHTRLQGLRKHGVHHIKEVSRHNIKIQLRALCFCDRAVVTKVATNAESYCVQTFNAVDGAAESKGEAFWYTARLLQVLITRRAHKYFPVHRAGVNTMHVSRAGVLDTARGADGAGHSAERRVRLRH